MLFKKEIVQADVARAGITTASPENAAFVSQNSRLMREDAGKRKVARVRYRMRIWTRWRYPRNL